MKVKSDVTTSINKKTFKDYLLKAESFFTIAKAIGIALVIGAIIIAAIGANPIEIYKNIFIDPFGDKRHIGNIIGNMSWMIPVGLAFAVAFKTGLFNIGMSGQMLLAGTVGVMMGIDGKPLFLIIPVMLVMGALAGAVTGFLKAQFNVHEVVSSIMFNWIIFYIYQALIATSPEYSTSTSADSKQVQAGSNFISDWLSNIFPNSGVNTAIFLSIIAAVIIWALFKFTKIGFKLKATGFNNSSARAAGYNTKLNIIVSFAIAGALSGIAAMALYLGNQNGITTLSSPPSQGFDGITVSLIGMSNPLGILGSSFFVALFSAGKALVPTSQVSSHIINVIYALILISIAMSAVIRKPLIAAIKNKIKKDGGAK